MFYYIKKGIIFFLNDELIFTNHSMCKYFGTHIVIPLLVNKSLELSIRFENQAYPESILGKSLGLM